MTVPASIVTNLYTLISEYAAMNPAAYSAWTED